MKSLLMSLFFLSSLEAATVHVENNTKLERVSEIAKSMASRCGGPEKVLVIYDVDDTLLATPDLIGSIPFEKIRGNFTQAERLALRVNRTHMMTQPNTANLVKELQEQKFGVMAYTARSSWEIPHTLRELSRYGIDFSKSSPQIKKEKRRKYSGAVDKSRMMMYEYITTYDNPYQQGVFFDGSEKSGDAIEYYFTRIFDHNYRCIVYADDSDKYQKDFLKSMKENSQFQEAHFVHYTGLDERYARVREMDHGKMRRETRRLVDAVNELLQSNKGVVDLNKAINIDGKIVDIGRKEVSGLIIQGDEDYLPVKAQ